VSDAQNISTSNTTIGLGLMLRQAREAAGLSQAELARQLNLGARVVEAMEQENLHTLPGAVYVRGYLRKWADYLKLDEQQLQQAYARLSGDLRKNDMRHNTPIEPMRIKKSASSFPWFKLLFFMGIIGLGIFSTRFLPESMRFIETAQETPANTLTSPQLNATALPSIPLMPPPKSAPAAPIIATTPGIVVGETLSTASPPIPTSSTPSPIATPSPLQGLELQGQGNAQGSWVRVKDADARVIFEGILAPGTSKKLEGKRPFEITIGRASELKVMLDGKNIDLKAYAGQADKAFIPKLGSAPSQ